MPSDCRLFGPIKFEGNFIFKSDLICLLTCIAIASTQLSGLDYCYLTLLILFNIYHLFADSEMDKSII